MTAPLTADVIADALADALRDGDMLAAASLIRLMATVDPEAATRIRNMIDAAAGGAR